MEHAEARAEIFRLGARIEELRGRFGWRPAGEVIREVTLPEDDLLAVVADGAGGAALEVRVETPTPADMADGWERASAVSLDDEREALEIARLVEQGELSVRDEDEEEYDLERTLRGYRERAASAA